MCDKIHTCKKNKELKKVTAAVFHSGDMQKLIALGTIRAFSKNTMLLQEGDQSDQLYVVASLPSASARKTLSRPDITT